MKLSCEIVRDLLPLYAEELASEDSRAAVEAHLCECAGCRAELKVLKQPVPVPAEEPGIKKVRRGLFRRVLMGTACGILSILLVLSCVGWYLFNPIYLPESVVTSVGSADALYGWVRICASAPSVGYRWLRCEGRESTADAQHVVFYTCRFQELTHEEPFEEYVSIRSGDSPIWLFLENGEMKLLHGTPEKSESPFQWHILEKLSLWSGTVGGLLLVAGAFLRKKRVGAWALSVGALGICYAVCQWAVCGGSMVSFFPKRELLWAVLIAGCSWGIGMCIWGLRRKR